jgi:hypothetical protein
MTTFEIKNVDGTMAYELCVTGRKARRFASYEIALSHLRTSQVALEALGVEIKGPFRNGHSFSAEVA